MYCRAIACDFDGTCATDGKLAPEAAAALGQARAQGIVTLLVTGRVLQDIQACCADLSMFDAIVAENGAVVWVRAGDRTLYLGAPASEHFLGALRAHGIPFHTGAIILGTWATHTPEVIRLIRELGSDTQLVFNRDALMLLPSGVNKASGVGRALEEMGRSERSLIAFGDAENDIPMLQAAEIAVAARGSVRGLMAHADDYLALPGGAGIAHYLHRMFERRGIMPTPPRRRIVLGRGTDGRTAALPSSGINLTVTGDPRSGKSWLAGLVADRLIEHGYRLCIVDPEGDHVPMGQRPKILTLGHDLALPTPAAAACLFSDEPLSVILNLSSLRLRQQIAYVETLLNALETSRAFHGTPHWILIDEAHYFFYEGAASLRNLKSATGNFILATYRPSLAGGRGVRPYRGPPRDGNNGRR